MFGVGTMKRVLGGTLAVVAMAFGLLTLPAGASSAGPTVTKIAGTGVAAQPRSGSPAARAGLDGPQSLAVDAAGDIAIADTNACQVDVIASRHEHLFGRNMAPGHLYVVAGGTCAARHGALSIGFPQSIAWGSGGLFVVNRASDSVVAIAPSGHLAVVAGTGRSGNPHVTDLARTSPLDDPSGLATDNAGDLFIADTGDCRVLVVPRSSGSFMGQTVSSGHLYAVAGTGTCTLANAAGPARAAQLSAPTAVTVDSAGDLFITESGRQDVDEVPVVAGSYYGVPIGAGDIAPVAGSGSNNTFLAQGQPATGSYAELNYPGGTAVDGTGNLFIAGGFDHSVFEVPAHDTTLWGRSVSGGDLYVAAGAVPSSSPGGGSGDGTQWIGGHLADPTDVALSGARLLVVDAGANKVMALS